MDKARILVVEDESLLAEDIQERLKNLGYEVAAVAHSGEEALAGVAAAQPDLVLMDIRLKGKMDGIDTARVVRERFNLPVVYLKSSARSARSPPNCGPACSMTSTCAFRSPGREKPL